MVTKSKKTTEDTKAKKELEDEIYQMCKKLSYDMSDKVEELVKQRENMFLSLAWFLIATSGIIITASDVTWWAKCYLTWSIVCFVWWLFFNSNLVWAQAIKVSKSLKNVFPIPGLKTIEEKYKAIEKIENWIKLNKKDIFFTGLVSLLQNAWIVLFIIWLFKYL